MRRSVRAVMPMPVEEADEPALRAVERQAALAAVRRLPTRQREVLVLRYWSELTEAEIADTLGISAGSVEKMLRGER